jgi:hypothetical protein
MKFEGHPMTDKPGSRLLDQSSPDSSYNYGWTNHPRVGIAVVSGDFPNRAGHALLCVRIFHEQYEVEHQRNGSTTYSDERKGHKSYYYHVPHPGRTTPLYLDRGTELNQYLTDHKKHLIGTCWLRPGQGNPSRLLDELQKYAHGQKKYTWLGAYHNCWSFAVETAKQAGYVTPSFGALRPKTPIQLLNELKKDGTWNVVHLATSRGG